MLSLPLYNVPLYVFLPITITFDFSGPKDDFDLYVTVCAKISPLQGKLKSRKREEKQLTRARILTDRNVAAQCRALDCLHSYLFSSMLGRRRINHGI